LSVSASSFCAAVLGEPVAFGGDVDRAGRVQPHRDRAGGQRDFQGRGGVEVLAGGVQPDQAAHGLFMLEQARLVGTGQLGRHPLLRCQALVAAEAADLGDQLLHRLDPLRRVRVGGGV
jgi:hypothetical protein